MGFVKILFFIECTQLLHVQQGQLQLAQSLNHAQVALNQTINLVNQHSLVPGQHPTAKP